MHMAHLAAHGYIGAGIHNAIYPPAIPPVLSPHISADTLLGLLIKSKPTTSVFGPFMIPFIQQGSDSGMVVPHVPIPPPSVLLPIVIAFGSSKPNFSASTVQMDGKPVAANLIPFLPVAIPPSQQECNDPCNFPADVVICPNTVVVGLTLGDLIAGVAGMLLDSLISFIGSKIGGGIGGGLVKGFFSVALRGAAREAAQGSTEAGAKVILDAFVENAAERVAGQTVAGVIDKAINEWLISPLVEPVTSGVDSGIREGVDGTLPSNPAPANPGEDEEVVPRNDPDGISNGVTGGDGSDPRIGNAD